MKLQRYNPEGETGSSCVYMEFDEYEGEWVRYDDLAGIIKLKDKKINDLEERLDFCLEIMTDESWLKYDEEYLRE